jgi:hypothetical protein
MANEIAGQSGVAPPLSNAQGSSSQPAGMLADAATAVVFSHPAPMAEYGLAHLSRLDAQRHGAGSTRLLDIRAGNHASIAAGRPDDAAAQTLAPFEDIPAEPIKRRPLTEDEARRLAELPRDKISGTVQAALWSALTSLTGAAAGLVDIMAKTPAQPKSVDLLEMGTFIVCAAICLPGLVSARGTETADDFLKELFRLNNTSKPV